MIKNTYFKAIPILNYIIIKYASNKKIKNVKLIRQIMFLKGELKHFLNVPRLSLEGTALGRSFQHGGTTNENFPAERRQRRQMLIRGEGGRER